MTSDMDTSGMESVKSDEGGDYELWTEETVDIETPFTNSCQDDVEYLKLEIAELKQILIALAEKYKLSEDRRKVAERRNSFLKADNQRLQQMSDNSLSQKIEAEIENRRTLDKLREFIDFKSEFEKQAELLKKIISHLPKMRNAATSCTMLSEIPEKCLGDGDGNEQKILRETNEIIRGKLDKEIYFDDIMSSKDDFTEKNERNKEKSNRSKDDPNFNLNNSELKNLQEENVKDISETDDDNAMRLQKEVIATTTEYNYTVEMKECKSKTRLSKLKQEVLSLKNMNDWKSSDLEYKNRQLAVKNRELVQAKKEITQLKMQVNRLLIEQQKRPQSYYVNPAQASKMDLGKKSEKSESEKSTKSRQDSVKMKQSHSKLKLQSAEGKQQNKSQLQVAATAHGVKCETAKLPISTETVWQEIAPGDQVRIKLKKGAPER